MFDAKTIIWFVMTLLLMGFFSGIEMAFYSANRLGIELKKKQGTSSGKLLGQFIESPVRFLGTTLIGFNIFSRPLLRCICVFIEQVHNRGHVTTYCSPRMSSLDMKASE